MNEWMSDGLSWLFENGNVLRQNHPGVWRTSGLGQDFQGHTLPLCSTRSNQSRSWGYIEGRNQQKTPTDLMPRVSSKLALAMHECPIMYRPDELRFIDAYLLFSKWPS
jgi:hypothetical protein